MKYTDEQKAILSICRKYSKVVCKFHGEDIEIYIDPNWDREEWFNGYGKQTKVAIEDWLKNHATPKQVGRPKGSIKPSRKVKRDISLSADQWSKVEEIRRTQGLKYTSHAIGLAVEAFSETDEAYKKGYSDGYSEGYDQGYEDC